MRKPPPNLPGRRDSLVGHTISDRYRIEELVATGGMGRVYRGEHVHMHKRVAVKVLRPDVDGFRELAARFQREAIVGAHLDHPNVASATDFGWLEDGSAFLVLQFVGGVTLREIIRRGPLPAPRAWHIGRQIASALAACHALGVLHRDIKPRNIMVDETRGDRVKLIDFGLARVSLLRVAGEPRADSEEEVTLPGITHKGVVFGTVPYMPPEIALGMEAIDERSDLYALGVVLYEMLAGVPPFDPTEPADVLWQQRTVPPPPLGRRARGVEVPPALEAVVMRLLASHPAERFSSANELLSSLDAAMAASVPSLPAQVRPATPSASTMRVMPPVLKEEDSVIDMRPSWGRRFGLLAAALAAVALTALVLDERLASAPPPPLPAALGIGSAARARGANAVDEARGQLARERAAVEALSAKVRDAHERRAWQRGGEAVVELIDTEPRALDNQELVDLIVSLAVHLEFERLPASDALFGALADRAGTRGHDVLYAIVAGKGGSRAASRAERLLRTAPLASRLSPPLAIALALREASCRDKPRLFARAAREGDERSLRYLERLRSARCNPSIGECCFHGDRRLAGAIEAIAKRL